MKNGRQLLLNKLGANGIGLSGSEFDKRLKEFNNFRNPLSEMTKDLLEDENLFKEFITFIQNGNRKTSIEL